jgi:hypothetical protein
MEEQKRYQSSNSCKGNFNPHANGHFQEEAEQMGIELDSL